MSEWIGIKDQPLPTDQSVLAWVQEWPGSGYVSYGTYNAAHREWVTDECETMDLLPLITHWMPLPDPPTPSP